MLFRYGIVGVAATLAHGLTALLGVTYLHFDYLWAHSLGFVFGLLIAYFGHYFYSFKDSHDHKSRFPKFVFMSVLTLFIHEFGAYLLVSKAGYDYKTQTLPFLLVIVPIFSFLVTRFWVFNVRD